MEGSSVSLDEALSPGNNIDPAPTSAAPEIRQKRSRIVLSCAPCRASKLKCDRAEPCSQCLKKSRAMDCIYAPKPVKKKPPKGMAARLKRLEAMVRGILDEEGNVKTVAMTTMTTLPDDNDGSGGGNATDSRMDKSSDTATAPGPDEPSSSSSLSVRPAGGKVIQADNGARGGRTTYVGATHFMAMLDDIQDLKSYFDQDPGEPGEESSPDFAVSEMDSSFMPGTEGGSMAMPSVEWISNGAMRPLRNRQQLLDMLPPKHIADRLVMRYFTSGAASLHIVHKPSFSRKYARFWVDPTAPDMDIDWMALLFVIFALAIFFSSVAAPHELANDNINLTPTQRFQQYRAAAGWAISTSTSTSRSGRNATIIRIMLKLGLHRDASQLPYDDGDASTQISVFDGEMRRRLWHLAIQLDLMISFHLGLPSMAHGIESDTLDPHNLLDEDFDEDSTVLPPERTGADYTPMTYAINKAKLMRRLGQVARQAHSLTMPSYAEVVALDQKLEATWSCVPQCMRIVPLDAAITDPPSQVIQRFGLGSLYQKTRCVLHRRYLAEKNPKPEQDYSRRACLLAALALLEYQNMLFEGTKPGGLLCQHGWFVSSLAVHDFLLGATVVYIVLQDERYDEPGGDAVDYLQDDTPLPNKRQLLETLRRSYWIWRDAAANNSDVRKAPGVLEVMFRRIAKTCEARGESFSLEDILGHKPEAPMTRPGFPMGNLKLDESSSTYGTAQVTPETQVPITRDGFMKHPEAAPLDWDVDATWLPEGMDMVDWASLETAIRTHSNLNPSTADTWMGPVGTDSSFDHVAFDGPVSTDEPLWPEGYM